MQAVLERKPIRQTILNENLQDVYTRDCDAILTEMDDYRREDGSGFIQIKNIYSQTVHQEHASREVFSACNKCGIPLLKEKKCPCCKKGYGVEKGSILVQGFKTDLDEKIKKKTGWNDEQLEEYRKMKAEMYKEAIKNRPKRGKIRGFSSKSRKRLMDEMQKMEYMKLTNHGLCKAKFLTLTYPRQFPDGETAKKHLQSFMKRLKRRYPRMCAIWRLEWQERGAPHFHIIFFRLPRIEEEILSDMWADTVGKTYMSYHKGYASNPFIRIETVQNIKGVMWYVSKYISKKEGKESDNTTASETANTARLDSVPYLTAKQFKLNFELIETIMNRAYEMGEDFHSYEKLGETQQERKKREQEEFRHYVGSCIKKWAFPDEFEKLCPSCGRVWGKHNKDALDTTEKTTDRFWLDFATMQKLKKYIHITRSKNVRINNDSKGVSFYVNDDVERQWLMKLLNSAIEGNEITEGAPF